MIRVVLAVVLASALLGVSLPVAERAERDRNAAIATAELTELADRADRLAADNDPVPLEERPATATVSIQYPAPTLTDGGRFLVTDDRLVWVPQQGPNRTVDSDVPIRTEEALEFTDSASLHIALYRVDGRAVVDVSRARVEKERGRQTAHALRTVRLWRSV